MQQKIEDRIHSLLSGIEAGLESFKEVKRIYDVQVAFDFSPLNFFRLNENKLSEILAFFLNPTESHGQGSAFLRVFLHHFAGPSTNCLAGAPLLKKALERLEQGVGVLVKTEDRTGAGRRIDVTIRFCDQCAIGIENKIWAVDQIDQLDDYSSALKEWSTNDQFFLFYLTPDGHEPSVKSISVERCSELKREGMTFPTFGGRGESFVN